MSAHAFDYELQDQAKEFAKLSYNHPEVLRDQACLIRTAYLDLLEARGLPPKQRLRPVIGLASGASFDFTDPKGMSFEPTDMAHALARIPRFAGHTVGPITYSVAQHLVLAAGHADPEYKFEVLMHDAHEFVVGDITTPLKQLCPDLEAVEDRVSDELRRRFHLPLDMTPHAKSVDVRMAATEIRDVMQPRVGDIQWEYFKNYTPYDQKIEPWPYNYARIKWLEAFTDLYQKHMSHPGANIPYAQ